MSSKTKRLGGLADVYQAEHLDGAITRIRLDKIRPSADQPRQDRTAGVDELAASIKKDGLLSPIVVTREGDTYRIIAGERRYHALLKNGADEAEVRIISREERDYWRISIIENLQRENLSAQEEATALLKLKKQENYSDADLAAVVGKSRNYVTEILGIASLPGDALKQCAAAGIQNKNLLIQAVQAHKRGALKDFISAFETGALRTVRSAKDFNKTGDSQPTKKSDSASSQARPSALGRDPADYGFTRRKGTLTVRCPNADEAALLEEWIRKRFLRA